MQDLHDIEQQQDKQEESWGGSSIDGFTEGRDLEPDQLQCPSARKDVWPEGYTLGYTVTYYSFHDEMFLCFVFSVCVCVLFLQG